ncbi:hypothetical protein B5M09_010807 [Aphanomyces astaci]|uniref:EF-hand domain-containing protein n=1 Tax=Aphanomyces astaci TaxID=112090 RepID=A0A425DG68_APHAT|nr:hypothetical protein B5M09_010807 [Aphanomyces astaci]
MREYQKYLGQINTLQCNGSRPFAMPASACVDQFSKRWIALFDFNRDHNSITNDECVAWCKSAFEEDPQDLGVFKQSLQRAIRFDTEILVEARKKKEEWDVSSVLTNECPWRMSSG